MEAIEGEFELEGVTVTVDEVLAETELKGLELTVEEGEIAFDGEWLMKGFRLVEALEETVGLELALIADETELDGA